MGSRYNKNETLKFRIVMFYRLLESRNLQCLPHAHLKLFTVGVDKHFFYYKTALDTEDSKIYFARYNSTRKARYHILNDTYFI